MSNFSHSALAHVNDLIREIAYDNKSGAAEILRKAGKVFSSLDVARSQKSDDNEQTLHFVIVTASALALAQPLMAPLANLASAAVTAAAANPDKAIQAAAKAAEIFIHKTAQAQAAAQERAAELIEDGTTILTHSRSSTALNAFIQAHRAGRRFDVIATESRPMYEGRALAESLAREGVVVTLIADAAAAFVMNRVDMALMGADKVTPSHLVNKIGTRMITLAARERSLPVYTISDTSKFINAPESFLAAEEERSAEELWRDAPSGIAISNRYFELVPLDYFIAIITEDGPLAPAEAARRARAMSINQALLEAIG